MAELLEQFILDFATNNIQKVQKEIKETKDKIKSLEDQDKEYQEVLKKGGKLTKEQANKHQELTKKIEDERIKLDSLNNSWQNHLFKMQQAAKPIVKMLGHLTALGTVALKTAQFANEVLEVAEAAEKAKQSLEEYQKAEFGRQIFTRDDVNNAKEFEFIQRDIKSGLKSIGADLSRLFLPVLTSIFKITRNLVNFFAEHAPLIKITLLTIGTILGIMSLKHIPKLIAGIGNVAKAFWGLIAANPIIAAIIAVIIGLILVLDDLYAWFTGGNSALGKFWDDLFGGVDGAKAALESLKKAWAALTPIFKIIGDAIMWVVKFAIKALVVALIAIPTIILGIIDGIKHLIGWIAKIPDTIKTILHIQNKEDSVDGSHAAGLDYVPFDNYTANLHKGEAVLTQSEADDWRTGVMAAKKAINFTANYPLNSIPSSAINNAYNNDTNKVINIGDIVINTQATDSQGIATDLKDYIKQAIISLDDGMLA